jgi:DNA-binding FadR family transcriptional regulator
MASDKRSRGSQSSAAGANLRLPGSIARQLGIRIVSGKYRPGDVLEGEVYASDSLKVSRPAYREAMRILAAKGLVEARPKVGTRVTPANRWHMLDPDLLSWIFESEPSEDVIAGLFELRKIVEPQAAALAALRRSDYHLEVMSASLELMKKHTLAAPKGQLADTEFHATLLDATGNAFLVSLTRGITAAVSWTTTFKLRSPELPRALRDAIPDHERVYVAIEKQNRDAAQAAMADLIELAFKDTTYARRALRKGRLGR